MASFLGGKLTIPLLTADVIGAPMRVHLGVVVASVLAAVACVSLHSDYYLAEGVSTRDMGVLRLGHAGLVIVVGVLITVIATSSLRDSPGMGESIRNFLLFTGLGLSTIPAVAPRFSWILPTAVAVFYATVGAWLPHNPFVATISDGTVWAATGLALVGGLVAVRTSRFMGYHRRRG